MKSLQTKNKNLVCTLWNTVSVGEISTPLNTKPIVSTGDATQAVLEGTGNKKINMKCRNSMKSSEA